MNSYLEIAAEAARGAGAILMAEFDRPVKIGYKGEVDLVTEADRRSEAAVVSKLRSHFPKHTIIAEEGTQHRNDSEFAWHVDPLDGTTNFAHGYPCFAVSIGLLEKGEPLVGVVYNPVNNEMFTAVRGEGAFLNQRPIRVSSVDRLATSLLATGFPSRKRTKNPNIHYYWRFTLASHGVRRDGSAALDLCGIACGRFDGFWEFGLNSWDVCAGLLLVREAGGVVTALDGKPYRLGGPDILASNGKVHAEMQLMAADIAEKSAAAPL